MSNRSSPLSGHETIDELRKEINHYCELVHRVIDQAHRRVLQGEQVPNAEKIYSIFEIHTDLIKRGKVQTPIEFDATRKPSVAPQNRTGRIAAFLARRI